MYFLSETDRINHIISSNAPLTLREMAENDIKGFYLSGARRDMLTGERYYRGEHDILRRTRTAIGDGGKVIEVDNLPNNRIVDNVYKELVDQKVNYLLGKPITIKTESEAVKRLFNRELHRTLRAVGEDALNCGIGWLFFYFDNGRPRVKRLRPYEIIPCWRDSEHLELEYAIRVYETLYYRGKNECKELMAEIYTGEGVYTYRLKGGTLKEAAPFKPYSEGERGLNRVPLVAFKYNSKEIPLIKNVKTLQDGLNSLISDFNNCMEEDIRNTILVIKNYDGEDLGHFRRNLSAYGAVKVKTVDGSQGGVETLNIEVNGDNYTKIIGLFKRALIENGRGYNAKDDRLGSSPNQMNILSMYNDIDIDANGMETEFSASLEQLAALADSEADMSKTEFVFNRSMIMNESEVIDNIVKSEGLLDKELLRVKHPWVNG